MQNINDAHHPANAERRAKILKMFCGMLNLGSLHGLGYFVLQGLRVATVITLLAAAAGCWVLMISVDKYKSYFVFQCMSLFFTSVGCLFLILAEFPVIGFVRNFYRESWPVLSSSHGVGWLGLAMIVMGAHILGSLNQQGYDTDAFTGHFAKLVLSSGVLCIIFGVLNIICALVWRDAKQGITSRDIRSHGSLAGDSSRLPSYSASPATSVHNEKARSKFASVFWKNRADKQESNEGPRLVISGPYSTGQDHSSDARTSPIMPGVKRPDTALHPMHTGRSSHYSTADPSHF